MTWLYLTFLVLLLYALVRLTGLGRKSQTTRVLTTLLLGLAVVAAYAVISGGADPFILVALATTGVWIGLTAYFLDVIVTWLKKRRS